MEYEQVTQNLKLLQELICIGHRIWLWRFDAKGKLTETNCPDPVLSGAWKHNEQLLEIGKTQGRPIILTADYGCLWGGSFDTNENQVRAMYAIGPIFTSEVQVKTLEEVVRSRNLSVKKQRQMVEALKQVPAVFPTLLMQFLLMLQYCVTGIRAEMTDIYYLRESEMLDSALKVSESFRRDRHKIYQLEQTLMQMIRDGKSDYVFGMAGDVMNWFDKKELDPSCFSIEDTLADLKANPQTAPILAELMTKAHASRGEVAQSTAGNKNLEKMMGAMKLKSVLKSISNIVPSEEVKRLNEKLQLIKK